MQEIDFPAFIRETKPQAKPVAARQPQSKLIVLHERFFKKLESLVSTEEGKAISRTKATPASLQRIEGLINAASEMIPRGEPVSQVLGELYEEMLPLFGRGDADMRALNKALRDLITI